nr:unnamed protein product [Spirometra erinaceieuropaei]
MVLQPHNEMMAQVTDSMMVSEAFTVTSGVTRDCLLSPTLLSLMCSAMLMDACRNDPLPADAANRHCTNNPTTSISAASTVLLQPSTPTKTALSTDAYHPRASPLSAAAISTIPTINIAATTTATAPTPANIQNAPDDPPAIR